METSSQYLFVSYSSQDRNMVIPLAVALENIGIPIWIDQNKIHGGGDFTEEIPKAIRKSCAVLLFTSSSAFKSFDVKKEISIADEKRKPIIPLRLEDSEIPEKFEYNLVGRQYIDVYERNTPDILLDITTALNKLGLIFNNNKNAVQEISKVVSAIEHPEAALTELVPYMVDRIDQEIALRTVCKNHFTYRPRRPHILLVYGKYGQAMEEYLHRMQESSLPAVLRTVKRPDVLKWIDLNWTRKKNWFEDTSNLVIRFDQEIELELNLEPGEWPDIAPKTLTGLRKVLILCYRIRYSSWQSTHVAALQEWLKSWARITPLSPTYPLIVLLSVEYGDTKTPLIERIFRRKKDTEEHPIHAQISQLESVQGADITISKLPELGNVTFEDIEQWIRKHVNPPDPPAMIRRAKEIMEDLDILMDSGLPMEQLGEKLETLLHAALETK